ncbi:hypothetical protein SKA34_16975 [Photobacterium sp. SKA34]|uniref:AAA family ATPase n=1 Tax=Photobacterium sp. SKA34 TaxID=121723 RepID=UPI00006BEB44|nr:AAA family ATPase [Photobacterium sp. SKA34]EAR55882.1 hypothetical protein SKA34_16975 [Photobacterium sp. SKA34]
MISELSLENFAAFKKLDLKFTPGINIIIGENSCGKTQLLKSIYALSSEQDITSKLLGLFKPHNEKLSGIYHRGGKGKAKVTITDSSDQVSKIEFGPQMETAHRQSGFTELAQPVLIPTKEVLSLLEAIQSKAIPDEILKSLFDDSIVDLCYLLLTEPTKELTETVNSDPRLGQVIPMLVAAIGGRFEINDGEHLFVKGKFVETKSSTTSNALSAKAYAVVA